MEVESYHQLLLKLDRLKENYCCGYSRIAGNEGAYRLVKGLAPQWCEQLRGFKSGIFAVP